MPLLKISPWWTIFSQSHVPHEAFHNDLCLSVIYLCDLNTYLDVKSLRVARHTWVSRDWACSLPIFSHCQLWEVMVQLREKGSQPFYPVSTWTMLKLDSGCEELFFLPISHKMSMFMWLQWESRGTRLPKTFLSQHYSTVLYTTYMKA